MVEVGYPVGRYDLPPSRVNPRVPPEAATVRIAKFATDCDSLQPFATGGLDGTVESIACNRLKQFATFANSIKSKTPSLKPVGLGSRGPREGHCWIAICSAHFRHSVRYTFGYVPKAVSYKLDRRVPMQYQQPAC